MYSAVETESRLHCTQASAHTTAGANDNSPVTLAATSAPDPTYAVACPGKSGTASTLPNVLLQARDARRSRLQAASHEEGVSEGPDSISVTAEAPSCCTPSGRCPK